MPGGKPERDAERASLGLGERIDTAEHRSAQLVQPGEGKLHLRFDTGATRTTWKPGRLPDQVVQQGRLADPRLSPHHQDGALTASHVRYELVQDSQFVGSAETTLGAGTSKNANRQVRPQRQRAAHQGRLPGARGTAAGVRS